MEYLERRWNQSVQLVDSLGKYFYYHNHVEVSPPMVLADYNVPGEQFMVARVEEVPMPYQEIPYNPFLTGVHHRLYNDRSYDLRSPKIWKASLRNALATDVNHYSPEELVKTAGFRMAGRNNPDEITQFEKYGLVNAIFDVSNSEFHHPYDEDDRQFAKVSNPEVTVNLFSCPGECLVTISNGNRERDAVEVSLSRTGLGLEGEHGFVVFDTVSLKAVPAEDRDGWIALPPMTIVEKPRIFVVKTTRDNPPTLLWHDVCVRNCRMVRKDGSHADQYSESGAGVPNRPSLWGG